MSSTLRPDQRFERKIAELLRYRTDDKKARRTVASGAGPKEKGDVKHNTFHIEAKYTSKSSIAVNWKWWLTCRKQADNIDRIPCLALGKESASILGQDIIFLLEETDPTSPVDEDWKTLTYHKLQDFRPMVVLWHEEKFRLTTFPGSTNAIA